MIMVGRSVSAIAERVASSNTFKSLACSPTSTTCHPYARKRSAGLSLQRQFGFAVDRDVVVVVEDGQPIEAERTGEGRRFVADAFFEAAVARNHPGAVVDQVFAVVAPQYAFSERHPDAVGDALAEWTCRHFDGGVCPFSGCPGVFEWAWRNCLRSSIVRS